MLKKLSVSGFRSLRDFQLDIMPGLNVLVGPNGAGKTNIILFFEFMRAISSGPLEDAVAKVGGVSQVFAKIGANQFNGQLSSAMTGEAKVDGREYEYKYEFAIEFDPANQSVYFVNQDLDVKRKTRTGVERYFSMSFGPKGIKVDASKAADKQLTWFVKESKAMGSFNFFRDHVVTFFLRHSDRAVSAVSEDFSGRFALNVVPSNVKKLEDSSRRPGIGADGSGLAATLYAIKRGKSFFDDVGYSSTSPRITPPWESVVKLIQIAVPSIKAIEVVNDPFENTLKCKFTIGEGKGASVQPISSLSDGTVKWISLVLRLSTSKAALLLEEPENYLHPLMQREIVRLLRDSISQDGFVIVSTHSETLLNAVDVSEIVIVKYSGDSTRAFRVSNQDDVRTEVNETGFGLGYYYLAEALEDGSESSVLG